MWSVTHGKECGRGRSTRAVLAGVAWLLLAPGMAAPAAGEVGGAQEKKNMPTVSERKLLDQPQRIPALLAAGTLSVEHVPDPHWRADGCRACHAGTPVRAPAKLRDDDINRLCNTCHAAVSDHDYIHPVGMVPSDRMLKRMPRSMRAGLTRGGGKVTCITCHDLPMQCLPERARERGLNPRFFWDGPYRARTDLCYRCHDPEYYKRLNPHDQITDAGVLQEDRCLVCHGSLSNIESARTISDLEFNVRGDLATMCTGCHPWVPHPGGFSFRTKEGPNHLTIPSAEVARRMKRMERKNAVVLPLEPGTGRVFCATCHNPHERGVIKSTVAAKGADSRHRLRMAEICVNCHEK